MEGRTFLIGLLGPDMAGPKDVDGWFAADFIMAKHIYSELACEQSWFSCVDFVAAAREQGPYLWGHPKQDRILVFTKDSHAFYTLCSKEALMATFKDKLASTIAAMTDEDKLIILIFAHGEVGPGQRGVWIGRDAAGHLGLLRPEEINSMLPPSRYPVTLISTACFSGMWHDERTRSTFAATNSRDESLSFPISNSGCVRGGYFLGSIYAQLGRLGLAKIREGALDPDSFRGWTDRVIAKLLEMASVNPLPTVSVFDEVMWGHHALEVMCVGDSSFGHIEGFPRLPKNPDSQSVADYLFASKLPYKEGVLQLMPYFYKGSVGLPNAPSNMDLYALVRKYQTRTARDEDLQRLHAQLKYRIEQDLIAENLLSSLQIPRRCSIMDFSESVNKRLGTKVFFDILYEVYPFDEPPRLQPPMHRYMKPVNYVAWTALESGMDCTWFKTGLQFFVGKSISRDLYLESMGAMDADEETVQEDLLPVPAASWDVGSTILTEP